MSGKRRQPLPAAALFCVALAMGSSARIFAAEPAAADTELRVALIISNNRGNAQDAPLAYADSDARRFHRMLLEVGSTREENAFLLTNADPARINAALELARRRLKALALSQPTSRLTFLFYVSSHADANALHLSGSRLALGDLRARIEQMPANLRIGIIDACRTASRFKGGVAQQSEVPYELEARTRVEGTLFFLASGPGEPAQEWAYLRGSLFTHHLMAGLRGLADSDADGNVSFAEAYAHAFTQTVSQSTLGKGGPQHPSFDADLHGFGTWTFSRPRAFPSHLVLGEGTEGPFYISNARNELVAEFRKLKGARVQVAVAPGRYRVVRPRRYDADAADVDVLEHQQREVAPRDFVRVPLEAVSLRGNAEPLVARPWELGVGYALLTEIVDGAGLGHFAELSLRRRFVPLFFGQARLGYTQSSFDIAPLRVAQSGLRLAAGGGLSIEVWPAELSLGLEAQAMLVRQRISRDDAAQTENVFSVREPPRADVIFAAALNAGMHVPIATRLRLGFEGTAGVLRLPRWNGSTLHPRAVGLRVGLFWVL